jgi:hypothetical protein
MASAFRYWLDNMGDHTVAAWMCAGAFLLAGFCSWRERLQFEARSPERTLWASLSVLLFAIGLNKQLDLQILAIKELGALLGQSVFWGSRRPLAAVVLGALGLVIAGAIVVLARAVRVRTVPLKLAAGAGAILASLALARGTTGIVNDVLVTDLYGSFGDVFQVQVKDILELAMAAVIVVSCLGWRVLDADASPAL